MARYSDFLYQRRTYGQEPRQYALSFIEAACVDRDTVLVKVDMPNRLGSQYCIVRSTNGAAEDPTDGLTIASGRVSTTTFSLEDYPPPNMAYYTIFVFDDEGRWFKDAATSVLSPQERSGYLKTLQAMPRMFLDDTLNPLTPFNADSFMARFLFGVGLTLDEFGTFTDLVLPESRTNQGIRRMSHAWAAGLGLTPELEIGTAASYRKHRDAGLIHTKKGLPQGLIAYVEALTGWSVSLSRYENLLPTVDDASFEESFGSWYFSNARHFVVALQDAPMLDIEDEDLQIGDLRISGSLIYDLPYDYPLSPFAKAGAGLIAMTEPNASMILPGPDASVGQLIPAQEFRLYVFKAPCMSSGGATTVTPSIIWYDHRGEYISESVGEPLEVSEGDGYTVVVVDDQAPERTRFMRPKLTFDGEIDNAVLLDRLSLMDADGPYRDPNTVTIICSPDRVNLLSDASFEFNGYWTANEGELEITEEAAVRGALGARATGTPSYEIVSESIPALPGFSLTLSATAYGTGSAAIGIEYYDGSNTKFHEDLKPIVLTLSPVEYSLVSDVPSGIDSIRVVVRGNGTVNLDLMTLDRQERPQVYFDGGLSHANQDDSKYVIDSEHIYSALYNNRLLKLTRLRESLADYLPLGVSPRIIFWDSWDDEVQLLKPYGVDLNALPPDAPQNLAVLGEDQQIGVEFTEGATDNPIENYSYSIDGGQTWTDVNPPSPITEFKIIGAADRPYAAPPGPYYSELDDQYGSYDDYADAFETYLDTSSDITTPLTPIENGKTYYVQVRGITIDGYTNPSRVCVVVPRGVPAAPVIDEVTEGDQTGTIYFTPGFDNGAPIDSYQYSLTGGASWVFVENPSVTEITIDELENGVEYFVILRANNDAGPGQSSDPVRILPRTKPDPPVIDSLVPGNRTILVNFTPPAFDGGLPITHYELSIDDKETWTPLSSDILSSPVLIQELTNGTPYRVALKAVNEANLKSDPSNVLEATPRTVPGKPIITRLTESDQTLQAVFEVPDNGGAPLINIDYSVDDGENWTTRSPADPESALVISGLVNGVTYPVRVRATNIAGTGAPSDPVNGTPFTRPSPVNNLQALPDNEMVTLTWDPPTFDGGRPIAYYTVTVQPEEGYISYPLNRIDTGAGVTLLVNGRRYLFSVTATNTGNQEGDSTSVYAIPRTVPGPPKNLVGRRGILCAHLKWQKPDFDGGMPILTYGVRYTADDGISWSDKLVTNSTATEFTYPDLEAGTTYRFQTLATNIAGDGPWSDPSNEVTPIEPPLPPRPSVTAGDRLVDATWLPPLNIDKTDVAEYIVEYTVNDGLTWRYDSTVAGDVLERRILGLTNGVPVKIRVAANGEAGQSAWAVAGPVIPAGLPFVTITGALAGNAMGTLYFTTDGNGAEVIKVQYSATTTPGSYNWQDFSPSISQSPGRIYGLVNGTTYYVVMRAQNAIGYGPPSNMVTLTPKGVDLEPRLAGPNVIDFVTENRVVQGYMWQTEADIVRLGMDPADPLTWWPGLEYFGDPFHATAPYRIIMPKMRFSGTTVTFEFPAGVDETSVIGYDLSFSGPHERPDLELRFATDLPPELAGLEKIGYISTGDPLQGTFRVTGSVGSTRYLKWGGGITVPIGAFICMRLVTAAGPGPWGQGLWYGAEPGPITIADPGTDGRSKVSWAHPTGVNRQSYDVEWNYGNGWYSLVAPARSDLTFTPTEASFFLSVAWSNKRSTINLRVRCRGQYGVGRWRYYP